jgi:poly-beta-1,6-N-acetyl-D-glucosamine synthase
MNQNNRLNKLVIPVSLGIFVHNEERNIEQLLKSLKKQRLETARIDQIIVVSSGSYDKTNRLVRSWSKEDGRIKLLTEPTRRGKSAAINLFLQHAKAEVVITISGDLRLHPEAIEEITVPFMEDEVGMAGARPKPANGRFSAVGKEAELLWELHHQISLIRPKCGELVAFRNIIRKIPVNSAVDEATLEVLLQMIGYVIRYAPSSVVYNKGPLTAKEFITQRRRVYAGHQWLAQNYNYAVVTMQPRELIQVVVGYLVNHPDSLLPMMRLIALEVVARGLGWIDYHVRNKNPYVWKMISR